MEKEKIMFNNNIVADDEIDISQLILAIWAKKKIILIIFILSIAISLIVLIKLYPIKKTAKKDFFLNFNGIENYKNPDGTSFNKDQIIKPLILKNVYNKLENKYAKIPFSYAYLSHNVYIKEILPEEIEKNKNKAHYTNHFELYINRLDNNEIYNEILYEILLEYKAYFEKHFSKNFYFSKIHKDKMLNQYDYIDLINVIKNYVESMQKFLVNNLGNKEEKNNKVINSQYFMECYNVYNTNKLIATKVDQINAKIEQDLISKNRIALLQNLNEKIKQKKLLKNIEENKLKGVNEIIQNITNNKVKQNRDKEINFSLNSDFIEKQVQNNYHSFLIKNILNYTVRYAQLTAEIEFLKNKITSWGSKYKKSQNNDNSQLIIENDLVSLIDEYNQNVSSLNQIIEKSFKENFSNNIDFSSSKSLYQNVFNKKVVIIGFCVFFIFSFLFFIFEFFKKILDNR